MVVTPVELEHTAPLTYEQHVDLVARKIVFNNPNLRKQLTGENFTAFIDALEPYLENNERRYYDALSLSENNGCFTEEQRSLLVYNWQQIVDGKVYSSQVRFDQFLAFQEEIYGRVEAILGNPQNPT